MGLTLPAPKRVGPQIDAPLNVEPRTKPIHVGEFARLIRYETEYFENPATVCWALMSATEKSSNSSFMLQQLHQLAGAMRGQPLLLNREGGATRSSGDGTREFDKLTLATLAARRANGATYAAIAADLNKRGIRGRYGARWYSASVWKLLNRRLVD